MFNTVVERSPTDVTSDYFSHLTISAALYLVPIIFGAVNSLDQ